MVPNFSGNSSYDSIKARFNELLETWLQSERLYSENTYIISDNEKRIQFTCYYVDVYSLGFAVNTEIILNVNTYHWASGKSTQNTYNAFTNSQYIVHMPTPEFSIRHLIP